MNKKLLTMASSLAAVPAMMNAAVNQPNILLILVDDLGYADLSCQEGTFDVQTPNIDRIITDGIRFRQCYANSPVSSPSRASLMTGLYPDMAGVPGLIRTYQEDNWGYLREDATLLPQMLKQKNYQTALIGKWNLGLESPNLPNDRGFDYFHGFLGDMMDDYYTHTRCGYNYLRENYKEVSPKGHATDIFSDWAIDYLKKKRDTKSPFFLYLAYNAPHFPVQPPKEWYDKVNKRNPELSENRKNLVALIEHMDYSIGQVYKTLEDEGLLENTIIMFASDNGGHRESEANNGYNRGYKQNMYEGGIRVPFGISWKGHISPAVNDDFIMLSDIYPTLCEMLDIPIVFHIDGKSFLPVLKGDSLDTKDRMAYWVRREGFEYGGMAYYAARWRNFKILQNTPYEPIQFFDLDKDPLEQTPIQDCYAEIYRKLFDGLKQHIRKSGSIPWEKQNVK